MKENGSSRSGPCSPLVRSNFEVFAHIIFEMIVIFYPLIFISACAVTQLGACRAESSSYARVVSNTQKSICPNNYLSVIIICDLVLNF